ncbi:transmembrane protein 117-like isoform X2 [Watersipora subatra]|uniref:transmembrane protein 117-like isoform X2 n=1 Tax=Watersipora subatra TaxID=2589382 RepID=UPI00355B09EC
METSVSENAPLGLYDEETTRPPPTIVLPESTNDNLQKNSLSPRQSENEMTTPDTENSNLSKVEDSVASKDEGENSKVPGLKFKEAVRRVRRNSAESIGHAKDLLDPSAAKRDGEDEPDFWDKMSQYTFRMKHDWLYYFQHPYARLFVAYLVTFCNFLIYAEDPVAHSAAECNIIVVGNIYSFVITKYPPNGFSVLKVFLWIVAIIVGILIGKLVIHRILLKRLFRLQMFQEDMGSFMVMFLTTLLSLYIFSWIYNGFLSLGGPEMSYYTITGYMDMKNTAFMKAAACGTWLGDFLTAWMVTDVMLQERFYPEYAKAAKVWWRTGYHRIILFWCMAVVATILVIMVIATDWIRWDNINASFLATNELSRAFLASFILVMDLLIVMQDWDFPQFMNHLDIKLPGLNTADLKITVPKILRRLEAFTIHITGKWFNYGIIFLVMILDLNMWKNQIFYAPEDFAQYTDDEGFIYSFRPNDTNVGYLKHEGANVILANSTLPVEKMESKYLGFSLGVKAIAFIPSLAVLIAFIVLIVKYGRVKRTKADPYAGRLQKSLRSKNKMTLYTIVKMKLLGRKKVTSESTQFQEVESRHSVKSCPPAGLDEPDNAPAEP